jgi:hypothetical protein
VHAPRPSAGRCARGVGQHERVLDPVSRLAPAVPSAVNASGRRGLPQAAGAEALQDHAALDRGAGVGRGVQRGQHLGRTPPAQAPVGGEHHPGAGVGEPRGDGRGGEPREDRHEHRPHLGHGVGRDHGLGDHGHEDPHRSPRRTPAAQGVGQPVHLGPQPPPAQLADLTVLPLSDQGGRVGPRRVVAPAVHAGRGQVDPPAHEPGGPLGACRVVEDPAPRDARSAGRGPRSRRSRTRACPHRGPAQRGRVRRPEPAHEPGHVGGLDHLRGRRPCVLGGVRHGPNLPAQGAARPTARSVTDLSRRRRPGVSIATALPRRPGRPGPAGLRRGRRGAPGRRPPLPGAPDRRPGPRRRPGLGDLRAGPAGVGPLRPPARAGPRLAAAHRP